MDIERVVEVLKDPYATGAAGAVVALRFVPGLSIASVVLNLIGGTVLAWTCAPWLFEFLGPTLVASSASKAGMSFLMGMLGMSLTDAIVDGIRKVNLGSVFGALLERVFGIKKGGE